MDMTKLSEKMKGFQRRATQKVLQQMGMADKTQDDACEHAYQNFSALGTFTAQLKASVQTTNSNIEKVCTSQSHLAGQVQSYLHTELSGDADLPPGELYEFFNTNPIPDAKMHAVILQDVSEKFYAACSEIASLSLPTLLHRLDDSVINPITRDEEYNSMTKELIDEKKKATLDYDAYRRTAANSSTPSEQEKNEAKLRQAKDRFDISSRRVIEHIEQRDQVRCKVLVHGILNAMQQYYTFYSAAADVLKDTATIIKPLLDVYQLNESQLFDSINLESLPQKPTNTSNPSKPQKLSTADSLFEDQAHNNSNNYNGAPKPPKPSSTSAGRSSSAPVRNSSPQHRDDQLHEMMYQSIAGMKKSAAVPPPKPNQPTPMNQQIPTSKTPPPNQPTAPPQNQSPNQTNQNQGNQNQSNQTPSPPPKPNLVDDIFSDNWSAPSSSNTSPIPSNPPADILNIGNLNSHIPPSTSPPQPQPTKNTLFDDDIFSTPLQPSTPPLQPNLAPLQPQRPNNNNNNTNNNTNNTTNNNNKSAPPSYGGGQGNFPTGNLFDIFGQSSQSPPPSSNSNPNPTPAPASSYVPQHQHQEQEERQELNPAVTEKIRNWAERGGRQTNLRALLSTLHEVIWVDSGWDALSLSELVTSTQVKKAYRRANMIVHPDKVASGTVEQKLIAQRLFEALRVSYEAFNREEGGK